MESHAAAVEVWAASVTKMLETLSEQTAELERRVTRLERRRQFIGSELDGA
jgi:hypothetical protein